MDTIIMHDNKYLKCRNGVSNMLINSEILSIPCIIAQHGSAIFMDSTTKCLKRPIMSIRIKSPIICFIQNRTQVCTFYFFIFYIKTCMCLDYILYKRHKPVHYLPVHGPENMVLYEEWLPGPFLCFV